MAASDERLKTNVADGDSDADEFMSSLRAMRFRYKEPERWGEGQRLGIMAQDLQRSKLGREALVQVDDRGHLGFDLGKATSAALASVARLNARLGELERKAA